MSYCTVEDLIAEGASDDEEQLAKRIALACDFIDSTTGQWFEPREKTLLLDGRGGQNLALPIFAISVETVKIGLDFIHDYVVYNRMEDRTYPKLFRNARWPKGRLNIEVFGSFGYVEEDMSTPADIKHAAMKLALYNFPALSDAEAQEDKNLRGLIQSETTDGHSYSLAGDAVSSAYAMSITGDTEIDSILRKYMRSRFRIAIV